MYLTDVYKYLNSLRKEEIPVAGYVFRPGDDGNPDPGTLLPLYSLTDPDWEYLPMSGYEKALDDAEEVDPESRLEYYKHLRDYSTSNLNELYKRRPCMAEEDISLDVAEVLYDSTHQLTKWKDLESFQRSQFISEMAGTIDKSNGMNKNIKADVSAKSIAAKKAACSVDLLKDLIKNAIPGVVDHFTGAPMFINSNKFNLWHFSFNG